MLDYQKEFIQFAIERRVLRFGQFTLKSGRNSPYFFNAGLFNTSHALTQLGCFYAEVLTESPIDYDLLFGPAYKGIPLVSSLATALTNQYNIDVPYAFNRKEAKDHGEGGSLVGAPLAGKVVIVDDVITAGTAIREILNLITDCGAQPAGVIVAIDRQERGQGKHSAIQEIQQAWQIPVRAIIQLDDVLEYLQYDPLLSKHYKAVVSYRQEFGI